MSANVIIQTAFLGDLLLSIPLLKKTKELWPQHTLVLICRKGLGDFFLKLKLVDEVLEIQKGNQSSYNQALKKLTVFEVDNLISPHESLRTCFFTSKVKARKKISFKSFRAKFFYDQLVEKDLGLPDAIRQLSLLSFKDPILGQQVVSYKNGNEAYARTKEGKLSVPPLWSSMASHDFFTEQQNTAQGVLKKLAVETSKPLVAIFPGSVWATKRWTEQGFAELSKVLSKNYQVLVMGGPGEEELCARIASTAKDVTDLCGKTSIYESALILSQCQMAVGNDSASMHLASVVDIPVVAIFGPTIPEFGFRPWNSRSIVVETAGLSCRPCGKHGHKKCPIKTHVCMEQISVQQVLSAVQLHSSPE